jgi:hypothetical protein
VGKLTPRKYARTGSREGQARSEFLDELCSQQNH